MATVLNVELTVMLARALLRAPHVPQDFFLLQKHVQLLVHLVVSPAQVLHHVQLAQLGIFCLVLLVRPVPLVVRPALLEPLFVLDAL